MVIPPPCDKDMSKKEYQTSSPLSHQTYLSRSRSGEPFRQKTYGVINLVNGRVSATGETIFGLSGAEDEGNR